MQNSLTIIGLFPKGDLAILGACVEQSRIRCPLGHFSVLIHFVVLIHFDMRINFNALIHFCALIHLALIQFSGLRKTSSTVPLQAGGLSACPGSTLPPSVGRYGWEREREQTRERVSE